MPRKPTTFRSLAAKPWFDTSHLLELRLSLAAAPVIPNTGRNQWRGPGNTQTNASLVKNFHIYRESEFQIPAPGGIQRV